MDRPPDERSREPQPAAGSWRDSLREIIFEADTPAGQAFDIGLLVLILASLVVVSLESVDSFRTQHGFLLRVLEWTFTALFTIEYVLRCATVARPLRYARSFFGLVDLLAILPTWMSLFVEGSQSLAVIRTLRLLRIFRVLKLVRYSSEAAVLARALRNARAKITVFVGGVLCSVVISGALMYFVEGPEHGFDNIPRATYWAIVTLTTVGYGDIAPQTPLGQAISACIMLLGYGIIAVPTGILSAELAHVQQDGPVSTRTCPACTLEGHDLDASFCKGCGAPLARGNPAPAELTHAHDGGPEA
jgi:voltage-gated potassium channel